MCVYVCARAHVCTWAHVCLFFLADLFYCPHSYHIPKPRALLLFWPGSRKAWIVLLPWQRTNKYFPASCGTLRQHSSICYFGKVPLAVFFFFSGSSRPPPPSSNLPFIHASLLPSLSLSPPPFTVSHLLGIDALVVLCEWMNLKCLRQFIYNLRYYLCLKVHLSAMK